MGVPDSGLASAVAELTAELAALRADRARRRLLDLASGVLAAQLGLSPGEAGDHLLRLAGSSGLSAVDLAADIVNAVSGTPPAGSGPEAAAMEAAQAAAAGAAGPPTPGPAGRGTLPVVQARRIRRSIAAALSSDTASEAATGMLEDGLHRLGVEELYLWRRTPTDCLELSGRAGADPQEASHWRWVPPETAGPLHRVLADARPLWYPEGPGTAGRLPGPGADAARAVLPLERGDRMVGVALAVWAAPADLGASVRAAVEALCRPAGLVLDEVDDGPDVAPQLAALLAQLDHPAVVVRLAVAGDPSSEGGASHTVDHLNPAALRERTLPPSAAGRPVAQLYPGVYEELIGLVARAGAAGSPQYAAALPAAPDGGADRAGAGGPTMAEVRVLPLGGGRAVVLWRAGVLRGPPIARALERLERLAAFEDDPAGGSRWSPSVYPIFGIDPGEPPVPLRALGARLHQEDTGRLDALLSTLADRQTGGQTLVRVYRPDGGVRHVRISAEPVLAGGAVVGITGVYQDVSAQHHTELALSATFDQLSAAQADALVRSQVVLRLQQTIVPETSALQAAAGLQVAARYRPAAVEYRVGGDWYDVFQLPGGRVLVTVGDIAGHGIGAATAMVTLRGALHGLAFTGGSPGTLMRWLNEVASGTPDHPTATAVCALFDPADRSLRWAGAGHPPPLLLRGGRARFLEGPPNVLLGALPGAVYEETTSNMRAGDTLMLYTDGLVERRHTGLDESLAALRAAAERLGAGGVEDQADLLLSSISGDTDDDTCLVVVHVS
ncbi:SpoIIE family protein phosphatase [Streptomyces sp. NPDC047718]|uniref:PP2C family protein-serine/threonine phosphatase n=1 Tax=Streptomyces sp. NPDC047718 TaxID=3155479 RepID=UPI0034006C38